MKDFVFLKILDRFSFLFTRLGADYKVMRKILQMKLIMDNRRVPTIMSNSKKSDGKGSFKTSLLIYGFMGLFIGVLILFPFPLFFKMNMVFGVIIFMVMTTMISDFSDVLLDIKDKNILLPRPVSPQTINTAKLIHIVIYLFSITMAIAGPALAASLFVYGFTFFLIFVLELILICCFVILFTSIIYSLILKFFDGEKLKDIINYVQIILAVFMTVAYQLIGRIFEIVDINITYTPKWWNVLLPSTWFAAPFSMLIEHSFTKEFIIQAVTGLVIPAAALIIYTKAVTPYFEKNLQKLNNNSGSKRKKAAAKEKRQRVLAKWLCYDKLEGTFFLFSHNMLSNERKLKLKIYPNLALSFIFPFIFIINVARKDSPIPEILTKLSSSRYYLWIYLSAALLTSSIQFLSTSERYKGAWIYRALPITSPVPVIKGALKSFILKYILPVYILLSLLFIGIYGVRILLDIILMFINMIILLLFVFKFKSKELPFYKDFQYTQGGSSTAVMFLSFAICGILAAAHYFMGRIFCGVGLNTLISLLLLVILWKSSFKFTWKDVAKS
ncbi:MAG: ABC transporter permease [Clostridiaceae bacterium]